jgi:murein DD-endopeptidase MepM/ murein hydrolase activator NlpD
MPVAVCRAARRRGIAYAVAVALCLGPSLMSAQAQDGAPSGGPAAVASGGEIVLLREQPGYDAVVLTSLGDGSALDVAGTPVTAADGSSWLPVYAAGQSGYIPAGYVAGSAVAPAAEAALPAPAADAVPVATVPEAVAPDPLLAAPLWGAATTTTDANLRSGPSGDADVLTVLPPGTAVTVDGEQSNGFVPVSGNGLSGWIALELLTQETTPLPAPLTAETASAPVDTAMPAPAPAPETAPVAELPAETGKEKSRGDRGESTGIIWPFSGGEWEVVQGYNNGTHENRSGFAQYKYSLDWARTNGKTAGQPVYAPVSGSVQWVDRGSGGMLIDAGNGYGVAVFHVTLDRGLGSGDRVERGQYIGEISGPGGDGYMSMAHIDITCWRLTGGGHEATPFTGPNAIAGMEFPDVGGANQHMGVTVRP